MAARAGYCLECEGDVWLKDGGGCVQGHQPVSVQSARIVPLPAELDRFNWGAFFFPVLWPLAKGTPAWAGLFFAIGLVGRMINAVTPADWWPVYLLMLAADLALTVWYGRNANRLLWEKRAWTITPPALLKSARSWGVAGLLVNGGVLALIALLLVVGR